MSVIFGLGGILLVVVFPKNQTRIDGTDPLFPSLLSAGTVLDACWGMWHFYKGNSNFIRYRLFVIFMLLNCTALVIWIFSRSGAKFCDPNGVFQGHGLWHILNAIATGVLYFYLCSETTTFIQEGQVSHLLKSITSYMGASSSAQRQQ